MASDIPLAKQGEGLTASPLRYLAYASSVALIAAGWNGSFPLDDAWITLHNARSLLAGGDATYGASPLVGATSAVHLALVALLGLVLPLTTAAFALGLVAAGAYVFALDRALSFVGSHRPILVIVGVLIGTVPIQLLNGLETGLAMAAVAGLLALADDRRLPFLAGLAPFIRPELGVLSAILLLRRCLGAPASEVSRLLGLAALTALPWVVWIYVETGQLLPATASAKIAFFAEGEWAFPTRLVMLVSALSASFLLPVFILGTWGAKWHVRLYIFVVLAVSVVTMPGSMNWNDGRYQATLVPALLIGLAHLKEVRSGKLVVALLLGWTLALLPHHLQLLAQYRAENGRAVASFKTLAASLPAGSRVLIHDAGMIAWSAPDLQLVDSVGLKTPESVKLHRLYTREACKWDRALTAIALSRKAEYAVVADVPFWRCVGTNLKRTGWTLKELPLEPPTVYRLYRLSSPQIGRSER